MRELRYRILNVFTVAGDRLSGNPLCVFEDGSGLDDATMQALALQFNLSETTFVLPSSVATARVRIFTPTFEMPFAGHPTLGTSQVVRELTGAGDALTLEMVAGLVPVRATGDTWTLRTARAPETRPVEASRVELAAMLGLAEDALGATPRWVDTGVEQLVIPLTSVAAVHAARPLPEAMARHGFSKARNECMAYVWARDSADAVVARFFFGQRGAIVEDPATGSACANLGGWHVASGQRDVALRVSQGEHVGRPSLLRLRVEDGAIFVSGDVVELGRGVVRL